mmetsp:Transcript_25471/g.71224  ORF Transcript_25471/g.71224 Transcript_25471/m.71224 type:complete len:318 (-) Transcript_25471:351-1304(-)
MTPASSNPFATYKSRELFGHKEKVYTVAWSCDGRRLASGSLDKTARVWSLDVANQGKLMKPDFQLNGHSQSVDTLCWDPSHPDKLATASNDKAVRIWDTRAQKCSAEVIGSGANINVTWSPNGQTIAFGNRDDVVSFLDVRKGKVMKTHKYSYEVNEIAWSSCGNAFFLTTGSGTIEVLQYPTMESLHSLKAHTSSCYCIGFDPASKWFATGGADALVSLWDLDELICMRTFIRMDTAVRTLSFSHDSQHLAFAAEDNIIEIADVESGASTHQVVCNSSPDSISWNPKHKILAYAGDERDGRQGSGPMSIGLFAPAS